MNICFMGSMKFAVPILEALNEKYHVSLVVTQPDKPVGRKKIMTPTPVKVKAEELGLDIFQPIDIRNDHQRIMDLDLDFIIVAAYGQLIPEHVLSHAAYQAINVHASLLPKYRGGSPMHRAIQNGDDITGVSIMFMAMKMDSGDILAQKSIKISEEENVGTLEEKLSLLGRNLLMDTLEHIDEIDPMKQDETQITFARNIKPEEEIIHWNQSAKAIRNHVRGFYPWPLTYFLTDGKKIKLYDVSITAENLSTTPGEIVGIDSSGVYVQTLDGLVILQDLQLQGKNRMLIKDFMNGVGKSLFSLGKVLE